MKSEKIGSATAGTLPAGDAGRHRGGDALVEQVIIRCSRLVDKDVAAMYLSISTDTIERLINQARCRSSDFLCRILGREVASAPPAACSSMCATSTR